MSNSAAGAFLSLGQSGSSVYVENILLIIRGADIEIGKDLSQALARSSRQRLLPSPLLRFFVDGMHVGFA